MPFYIYTRRRARLSKIDKYVGLLPKLYSDIFANESIKSMCKVTNVDRIGLFKRDSTSLSIFKNMLSDRDNFLYRSHHIIPDDIPKIIEMNIEMFKENEINYTYNKFIKFIEHLYRGHDKMDYGLYFSIIMANDSKDFLEKIRIDDIKSSDQRIIFYQDLDNLLNLIDITKLDFGLKSPLIYINNGWKYGKIDSGSLVYNKDDRDGLYLYLEGLEKLSKAELICQIPLYIENFNFTFGHLTE